MEDINACTSRIIQAAIEVHRELGPGLLESAYASCLEFELLDRKVPFESQIALPVMYKGRRVNCGFRMDFCVENAVIVEVKAVDAIAPVHIAQVLTYLRLSGRQIGLILNFNVTRMREGIKRLIQSDTVRTVTGVTAVPATSSKDHPILSGPAMRSRTDDHDDSP